MGLILEHLEFGPIAKKFFVNIKTFDFQDGRDYDRTVRASANLMYNPTANVMLGEPWWPAHLWSCFSSPSSCC